MLQAEGLRLEKVRCAEVHAARQVDPAGSAPHWDAVLAVEIPGPWPRDISQSEPFASLTEDVAPTITGADGRTWRPQGLVCERNADWVRMMAFERRPGDSGPFTRREWLLPAANPEGLVELARALIEGDSGAVAGHDQWRDDADEGTADLLLCTHGTRDVCCGGQGTALHGEVVAALGVSDAEGPGHRRRIWRTSHAGGHRFAPTALSFPEGVSWAHLEARDCLAILDRKGDTVELGNHMRGALSVDAGVAQVADREGFAAFGWEWLASERTSVLVAHDRSTLESTVEVMAQPAATDDPLTVSVQVALAAHIPMPTCGALEGPEFNTEPVWTVVASQHGAAAHR